MVQRLDIIKRLHERLLEIVRTALPLITSSIRDADLTGLVHLRAEMVEAIDAYCRHVHRLRETVDGRNPVDLLMAERLVDGCAALQGAYDAFRDRWAHRTASENWHEYRLSAVVMMKQVRDHVRTAEERRTVTLSEAA